MSETILRQNIMKRVHRIHFLRKYVFAGFTVKCVSLLAFFAVTVSLISIGDVFANMPNLIDASAVFYFSKYAFMNTEIIVQLLLISTVGFTLLIFKDFLAYTISLSTRKVAHY